MRQKWLEALDETLEERDTVFATLPIARLLEQEGILSELEGRGFTVYEPGQTQ